MKRNYFDRKYEAKENNASDLLGKLTASWNAKRICDRSEGEMKSRLESAQKFWHFRNKIVLKTQFSVSG